MCDAWIWADLWLTIYYMGLCLQWIKWMVDKYLVDICILFFAHYRHLDIRSQTPIFQVNLTNCIQWDSRSQSSHFYMQKCLLTNINLAKYIQPAVSVVFLSFLRCFFFKIESMLSQNYNVKHTRQVIEKYSLLVLLFTHWGRVADYMHQ